jgi:peroxiredoxin
MKSLIALSLVGTLLAAPAVAAPALNAAAPAFKGATASGETISLDAFKGKTVILEWTNDGCPFVKKHYDTGNMQKTQVSAKELGAVWISVISSAPGKQGHADGARANQLTTDRGAKPDYVLLDETGVIGKAYAAKTTPHMFIIDGEGKLRYDGAIDDKPSADHATVAGATNYVLGALKNLQAGEPVRASRTKPYGCSVKYGS